MPGRRIPPDILRYLGPCRQPRGLVEKVLEQCSLAKLQGELINFLPLVAIMAMVTEEFKGFRNKSFEDPKVRKAWCRVIQELQANTDLLEHNSFIPCRRCNQEFEPVVDEKLLTLFLTWNEAREAKDLVAIHLCRACGGQIEGKQTRPREREEVDELEDCREPESTDDEQWADGLVEEHDF